MTKQEQIKAMTKDEIKKAFAICCGVQDCTGCPILDMEKQNGLGCKFNLFTRVIDTVSEQEKEIERLKAKNKVLGDGVAKAFTNGFNTGREQVEKDIRRAKIDALKELKTRHDYANKNMGYPWDISQQIDELIKEVENDN